MKENNLKVLVVILTILVLCLGGFIIYDKVFKDNNIENKDNDNKTDNDNDKVVVDDSKIEIHNSIDYDNCNLDLTNSVNRFVCYNEKLFYNEYANGINAKDFLTTYLTYFSSKSDTLIHEEQINDINWKRSISKSASKQLINKYFGTLEIPKLDTSNEEFVLQEDNDNYYIIGRSIGIDNKILTFKTSEKIGEYEYKLIFNITDGYSNNFGTRTMKIKLNGNYYQIKEIS